MRPLSVILLLLSAFAASAFAQQPGEPVARSLRFYYAGFTFPDERTENPQARFALRNGRETVAVALNPNAFSSPLDYVGPIPAPLLPEQAAEADTAKPVAGASAGAPVEPLGELRCPADWQGILVLVVRNPRNAAFPFAFYPVECWGPQVPAGSVRVLNLLPTPLAARIGGSQSMIASRGVTDLAMPADRPDVPMKLAVEHTGRWDRILSTAVMRPEQDKMMLVVFPNLDGTPRAVIVRDLPAPPADQPSPALAAVTR